MLTSFLLSFVLGIGSVLPIFSGLWWSTSAFVRTNVDQAVSTVFRQTAFFTHLSDYATTRRQLAVLEQENRKLWAHNAQMAHELSQAQAIATISATFPKPSIQSTRIQLSTDVQGWFFVLPAQLSVSSGSAVLVEGVYVGTVSRVAGPIAHLTTIADPSVRIPVKHQSSGTIGIVRMQNGSLVAEFFSILSDLSVGQLFVTIKDQLGMIPEVVVCKVEEVLTRPADPVSRVRCAPFIRPSPGMYADIVTSS